MHGLLLAGMANCGKHFPGHGYVKPTHVDIPVDKRSLKAILQDDAKTLRVDEHLADERDACSCHLSEGG